jgi:hypothetical protein
MKASPQTQAAVQATLQQWKDAYARRDPEGALAVIAPDNDVVGIGTGPDEWRVGPEQFKAQLERDFAQSEALSIEYEPLSAWPEVLHVTWGAASADKGGRRDRWLVGRCSAWGGAGAVDTMISCARRSPQQGVPQAS